MRSLSSGVDPADDDAVVVEQRAELHLSSSGRSLPSSTTLVAERRSRPGAAIARAVAGWSPVTIASLMPAPPAGGDRVADARPGRVVEAEQAEQLEVASRRRRQSASAGDAGRRRDVRRPARAGRGSAIAAASAGVAVVDRRSAAGPQSGAPLTNSAVAGDDRHPAGARGSNGKRRSTASSVDRVRRDAEPAARQGVDRRLHRIADRGPPVAVARDPALARSSATSGQLCGARSTPPAIRRRCRVGS